MLTTIFIIGYSYIFESPQATKNLFNLNSRFKPKLTKTQKYPIEKFNKTKFEIKGVNLGGWLVTEPFITPSLFLDANNSFINHSQSNVTIVDELTMCKYLGQENAHMVLTNHYDTWITEKDIQHIKNEGFNLVRIPIGHWAWKDAGSMDSYVGGIKYHDYFVGGIQLQYLNRLLEWCRKYGLKAWIDLHTAPGSQNGFDNSGQRILPSEGELGWLSYPNSREVTLAVLKALYTEYTSEKWHDVVHAIEVLNEPNSMKISTEKILNFLSETLSDYAQLNTNIPLVIQNAFLNVAFWQEYKKDLDLPIIIDYHHYEVFDYSLLMNSQQSRLANIFNLANSFAEAQKTSYIVVGEWSGAITDCAIWLNGLGIGSRFDGTFYDTFKDLKGDLSIFGICKSQKDICDWDDDYKIRVRQFIEAQLVSYTKKANGWIFWNWKTESAPEWSYLDLVEHDLFPKPFENYIYFHKNGTLKFSDS